MMDSSGFGNLSGSLSEFAYDYVLFIFTASCT